MGTISDPLWSGAKFIGSNAWPATKFVAQGLYSITAAAVVVGTAPAWGLGVGIHALSTGKSFSNALEDTKQGIGDSYSWIKQSLGHSRRVVGDYGTDVAWKGWNALKVAGRWVASWADPVEKWGGVGATEREQAAQADALERKSTKTEKIEDRGRETEARNEDIARKNEVKERIRSAVQEEKVAVDRVTIADKSSRSREVIEAKREAAKEPHEKLLNEVARGNAITGLAVPRSVSAEEAKLLHKADKSTAEKLLKQNVAKRFKLVKDEIGSTASSAKLVWGDSEHKDDKDYQVAVFIEHGKVARVVAGEKAEFAMEIDGVLLQRGAGIEVKKNLGKQHSNNDFVFQVGDFSHIPLHSAMSGLTGATLGGTGGRPPSPASVTSERTLGGRY